MSKNGKHPFYNGNQIIIQNSNKVFFEILNKHYNFQYWDSLAELVNALSCTREIRVQIFFQWFSDFDL